MRNVSCTADSSDTCEKNPFRRWKILIYRVTSSFVFNLLRKAERNSDEGTFCRRARCTQSIILISRAARKARTAKRWKLLSYFPKITQKISARFEISESKIIRGMTRQIGVSGMETTSGGDETLKVGGALEFPLSLVLKNLDKSDAQKTFRKLHFRTGSTKELTIFSTC